MTRRIVISLLLSVAAYVAAGDASAHAPRPVEFGTVPSIEASAVAPAVRLAQRSISASEAKNIARRQVPGGEVVDISRNGSVYRVRIVARSGRVVDVLVDARTGRVVG